MQTSGIEATIVVNIPLSQGFRAEQRDAYKGALLREIASATGDLSDATVARIVVAGGTPQSIGLDFWLDLMTALEASFPGSRIAHVRFDADPRDVTPKAAAYAMRYRSLMNLQVNDYMDGVFAGDLETVVEQARTAMLGEHLGEWGFELATGTPAGNAEEAAPRIARLLAWEPGYVRLIGDATGVPADAEGDGAALGTPASADGAGIGATLASAGYREVASGLFARHPKYRSWFENTKKDELVGFGLASVSRYAGMSFTTTSDMDLYIEQAGRSSAIYENASVEQGEQGRA